MNAITREKPVPYEMASPTLLAQQPATVNDRPEKASAEWKTLRAHLESNLVMLRTWRQSWWNGSWSDLSRFILPRRSIWLTQSSGGLPTPNSMGRGWEINGAIVDPTATFAARVAAAGLMSGLASPSRPWFRIVPSMSKVGLDAAGQAWIDETQDRIYSVLARSNFYNSFAQECEDSVVFGTAPVLLYEDDEDLIRLYNPCVGEYYLQSSATMRINGLYRQFVMTTQQVVDFFGLEACSATVQKAWQEKGGALQVERIICHSIEPNFGIGGSDAGKVPGNFTWREVYWIWGDGDRPLSMRGFVECPFTASRWATQSNDAYGRSPGMDVLPDVMQLQVMTRRKAEAIEKQVRPPLVGDAKLKNQPSSTLPGHLTYVDQLGPGTGMRPVYEVQPDIRGMVEDLREIQTRIQKGLFNDLFLMLQNVAAGKMTAYEVAQRLQEGLQILGPVIENMLSDSLEPKLKRVFAIMQRRGMIEPLPKSLQGVPLKVTFVSMLALAQKASATGGMERLVGLIGNMVAVYPAVKDNLNADAFIREFNDLLGNPGEMLFSAEQVMARRQSDAQAAQAEQQRQALLQTAQAAGAAAPAAQVLANTQVGGGRNALAAMMGGGGVAP